VPGAPCSVVNREPLPARSGPTFKTLIWIILDSWCVEGATGFVSAGGG
jgi:hypothetical protein